MQISSAVGRLLKDARPRERRDQWSMTTATHQQKGQNWARENGNQLVQRLRRENRELRMERDILKKAAAFFAKESA
jgi:transposase